MAHSRVTFKSIINPDGTTFKVKKIFKHEWVKGWKGWGNLDGGTSQDQMPIRGCWPHHHHQSFHVCKMFSLGQALTFTLALTKSATGSQVWCLDLQNNCQIRGSHTGNLTTMAFQLSIHNKQESEIPSGKKIQYVKGLSLSQTVCSIWNAHWYWQAERGVFPQSRFPVINFPVNNLVDPQHACHHYQYTL